MAQVHYEEAKTQVIDQMDQFSNNHHLTRIMKIEPQHIVIQGFDASIPQPITRSFTISNLSATSQFISVERPADHHFTIKSINDNACSSKIAPGMSVKYVLSFTPSISQSVNQSLEYQTRIRVSNPSDVQYIDVRCLPEPLSVLIQSNEQTSRQISKPTINNSHTQSLKSSDFIPIVRCARTAIYDKSVNPFVIRNTSKQPVSFSFQLLSQDQCDESLVLPFTVSPSTGTLEIDQSLQILVTYEPRSIAQSVCELLCSLYSIGDESSSNSNQKQCLIIGDSFAFDISDNMSLTTGNAPKQLNNQLVIQTSDPVDKHSIYLSDNRISMPNTYMNLSSQSVVTLYNNTNIPIQFCWSNFESIDQINEQKQVESHHIHQSMIKQQELIEVTRLHRVMEQRSSHQMYEPDEKEAISHNNELVDQDELAYIKALHENARHHSELLDELSVNQLINQSVNQFTFKHTEYSISPLFGSLMPGARCEQTIRFAPKASGDFSTLAYLHCTGISRSITLSIKGTGHGPTLAFDPSSHVDLGTIKMNQQVGFKVRLLNQGLIDAKWQFDLSNEHANSQSLLQSVEQSGLWQLHGAQFGHLGVKPEWLEQRKRERQLMKVLQSEQDLPPDQHVISVSNSEDPVLMPDSAELTFSFTPRHIGQLIVQLPLENAGAPPIHLTVRATITGPTLIFKQLSTRPGTQSRDKYDTSINQSIELETIGCGVVQMRTIEVINTSDIDAVCTFGFRRENEHVGVSHKESEKSATFDWPDFSCAVAVNDELMAVNQAVKLVRHGSLTLSVRLQPHRTGVVDDCALVCDIEGVSRINQSIYQSINQPYATLPIRANVVAPCFSATSPNNVTDSNTVSQTINTIHFGEVFVRHPHTKQIELFNPANVDMRVDVRCEDDTSDHTTGQSVDGLHQSFLSTTTPVLIIPARSSAHVQLMVQSINQSVSSGRVFLSAHGTVSLATVASVTWSTVGPKISITNQSNKQPISQSNTLDLGKQLCLNICSLSLQLSNMSPIECLVRLMIHGKKSVFALADPDLTANRVSSQSITLSPYETRTVTVFARPLDVGVVTDLLTCLTDDPASVNEHIPDDLITDQTQHRIKGQALTMKLSLTGVGTSIASTIPFTTQCQPYQTSAQINSQVTGQPQNSTAPSFSFGLIPTQTRVVHTFTLQNRGTRNQRLQWEMVPRLSTSQLKQLRLQSLSQSINQSSQSIKDLGDISEEERLKLELRAVRMRSSREDKQSSSQLVNQSNKPPPTPFISIYPPAQSLEANHAATFDIVAQSSSSQSINQRWICVAHIEGERSSSSNQAIIFDTLIHAQFVKPHVRFAPDCLSFDHKVSLISCSNLKNTEGIGEELGFFMHDTFVVNNPTPLHLSVQLNLPQPSPHQSTHHSDQPLFSVSCTEFRLAPNQSMPIDVRFMPDWASYKRIITKGVHQLTALVAADTTQPINTAVVQTVLVNHAQSQQFPIKTHVHYPNLMCPSIPLTASQSLHRETVNIGSVDSFVHSRVVHDFINPGEMAVSFGWKQILGDQTPDTSELFEVTPINGVVEPGAVQRVEFIFHSPPVPRLQGHTVSQPIKFASDFVCAVAGGPSYFLTLSAATNQPVEHVIESTPNDVSQFDHDASLVQSIHSLNDGDQSEQQASEPVKPVLSVSQLSFGFVKLGQTKALEIELHNPFDASSTYTFSALVNQSTNRNRPIPTNDPFVITPHVGRLDGGQSVRQSVAFTPLQPGPFKFSYKMQLQPAGQSTHQAVSQTIVLTGQGKAEVFSITPVSINGQPIERSDEHSVIAMLAQLPHTKSAEMIIQLTNQSNQQQEIVCTDLMTPDELMDFEKSSNDIETGEPTIGQLSQEQPPLSSVSSSRRFLDPRGEWLVDGAQHRWILSANSSQLITLFYQSRARLGVYDQTINFSLIDGRAFLRPLYVSTLVTVPTLTVEIKKADASLQLSAKKSLQTTTSLSKVIPNKKWNKKEKRFDFGALRIGVGLQASTLISSLQGAQSHPVTGTTQAPSQIATQPLNDIEQRRADAEHEQELTLCNTSPFPIQVDLSFMHGTNSRNQTINQVINQTSNQQALNVDKKSGGKKTVVSPRPTAKKGDKQSSSQTNQAISQDEEEWLKSVISAMDKPVFSVNQSSLAIEPNQTVHFAVRATPQSIDHLINDTLLINIRNNPIPILFPVSCAGAMPSLSVSQSVYQFDPLLVGCNSELTIKLSNMSALTTRVELVPEDWPVWLQIEGPPKRLSKPSHKSPKRNHENTASHSSNSLLAVGPTVQANHTITCDVAPMSEQIVKIKLITDQSNTHPNSPLLSQILGIKSFNLLVKQYDTSGMPVRSTATLAAIEQSLNPTPQTTSAPISVIQPSSQLTIKTNVYSIEVAVDLPSLSDLPTNQLVNNQSNPSTRAAAQSTASSASPKSSKKETLSSTQPSSQTLDFWVAEHPRLLNFGDVQIDHESVKSINVSNNQTTSCKFCVSIDPASPLFGLLIFEPSTGVIAPRSKLCVRAVLSIKSSANPAVNQSMNLLDCTDVIFTFTQDTQLINQPSVPPVSSKEKDHAKDSSVAEQPVNQLVGETHSQSLDLRMAVSFSSSHSNFSLLPAPGILDFGSLVAAPTNNQATSQPNGAITVTQSANLLVKHVELTNTGKFPFRFHLYDADPASPNSKLNYLAQTNNQVTLEAQEKERLAAEEAAKKQPVKTVPKSSANLPKGKKGKDEKVGEDPAAGQVIDPAMILNLKNGFSVFPRTAVLQVGQTVKLDIKLTGCYLDQAGNKAINQMFEVDVEGAYRPLINYVAPKKRQSRNAVSFKHSAKEITDKLTDVPLPCYSVQANLIEPGLISRSLDSCGKANSDTLTRPTNQDFTQILTDQVIVANYQSFKESVSRSNSQSFDLEKTTVFALDTSTLHLPTMLISQSLAEDPANLALSQSTKNKPALKGSTKQSKDKDSLSNPSIGQSSGLSNSQFIRTECINLINPRSVDAVVHVYLSAVPLEFAGPFNPTSFNQTVSTNTVPAPESTSSKKSKEKTKALEADQSNNQSLSSSTQQCGPFSIGDSVVIVPAYQSVSLPISFQPTSVGRFSTHLLAVARDSSQSINLSIVGEAAVEEMMIDFPVINQNHLSSVTTRKDDEKHRVLEFVRTLASSHSIEKSSTSNNQSKELLLIKLRNCGMVSASIRTELIDWEPESVNAAAKDKGGVQTTASSVQSCPAAFTVHQVGSPVEQPDSQLFCLTPQSVQQFSVSFHPPRVGVFAATFAVYSCSLSVAPATPLFTFTLKGEGWDTPVFVAADGDVQTTHQSVRTISYIPSENNESERIGQQNNQASSQTTIQAVVATVSTSKTKGASNSLQTSIPISNQSTPQSLSRVDLIDFGLMRPGDKSIKHFKITNQSDLIYRYSIDPPQTTTHSSVSQAINSALPPQSADTKSKKTDKSTASLSQPVNAVGQSSDGPELGMWTFEPRLGHLMPHSSQTITCTFTAETPVKHCMIPVQIAMAPIHLVEQSFVQDNLSPEEIELHAIEQSITEQIDPCGWTSQSVAVRYLSEDQQNYEQSLKQAIAQAVIDKQKAEAQKLIDDQMAAEAAKKKPKVIEKTPKKSGKQSTNQINGVASNLTDQSISPSPPSTAGTQSTGPLELADSAVSQSVEAHFTDQLIPSSVNTSVDPSILLAYRLQKPGLLHRIIDPIPEPVFETIEHPSGQPLQPLSLYLNACVDQPSIKLSIGQSSLRFASTCMLASRLYRFSVTNQSDTSVCYEWKVHVNDMSNIQSAEQSNSQSTGAPNVRSLYPATQRSHRFFDQLPKPVVKPSFDSPFSIDPPLGTLGPYQTINQVIRFAPLDAYETIDCTASLFVDNVVSESIKLLASSTRPVVHINLPTINHSELPSHIQQHLAVGQSVNQSICLLEIGALGTHSRSVGRFTVFNPTAADYTFKLKRQIINPTDAQRSSPDIESDATEVPEVITNQTTRLPPLTPPSSQLVEAANSEISNQSSKHAIQCITTTGAIPSGQTKTLGFACTAYSAFVDPLCELYTLQVKSNKSSNTTAVNQAIHLLVRCSYREPVITLSELAILFPDSLVGQSNKNQLVITNHEDVPLSWNAEFVSTSINHTLQHINNPFTILPLSGMLAPKSSSVIKLSFLPRELGHFITTLMISCARKTEQLYVRLEGKGIDTTQPSAPIVVVSQPQSIDESETISTLVSKVISPKKTRK